MDLEEQAQNIHHGLGGKGLLLEKCGSGDLGGLICTYVEAII